MVSADLRSLTNLPPNEKSNEYGIPMQEDHTEQAKENESWIVIRKEGLMA